jgi:hypothetical protein
LEYVHQAPESATVLFSLPPTAQKYLDHDYLVSYALLDARFHLLERYSDHYPRGFLWLTTGGKRDWLPTLLIIGLKSMILPSDSS